MPINIPRPSEKCSLLLARGEQEIVEGNGHTLESVMADTGRRSSCGKLTVEATR